MGISILQEGRFADAQYSCFQAANCSNMRNAVLQGGLLANAKESRFQGAKNPTWAVLSSNEGDLLMLMNSVFRLRNVK